MKSIILSIKPQFSTQIFQGNKTVELRKSLGKSVTTGTKIYIYSSSPVQAIEGVATIDSVEHFDVKQREAAMTKAGCINPSDYRDYYQGSTTGVGLWLKNVEVFKQPIPLNALKTVGFTPPQAFTYGTDSIWSLIKTQC